MIPVEDNIRYHGHLGGEVECAERPPIPFSCCAPPGRGAFCTRYVLVARERLVICYLLLSPTYMSYLTCSYELGLWFAIEIDGLGHGE